MRKINRVNAILIELIIVVLFFAIASVITIRLFAKSYSVTSESAAKTELATIVEAQMNEYRTNSQGVGVRTIYYNEDMSICEEPDARYIETITASDNDNLPIVDVDVMVTDKDKKTILSFVTSYDKEVQ